MYIYAISIGFIRCEWKIWDFFLSSAANFLFVFVLTSICLSSFTLEFTLSTVFWAFAFYTVTRCAFSLIAFHSVGHRNEQWTYVQVLHAKTRNGALSLFERFQFQCKVVHRTLWCNDIEVLSKVLSEHWFKFEKCQLSYGCQVIFFLFLN